MPIRAITLHVITCDVCGTDDDSDGVLPLYDTPKDAADSARLAGWLVTADQQVICRDADEQHRAAVDALLPPEPPVEIDGQLHLDL